ncbi:hypothetical protein HAX54_043911 [Datura stramonium]|uniref:Uncharacterized protein n=1 Tax=Datura stramonium TaxID=4076 RepID=A0ABS8W5W8_DATST|nr:hypothetical protein [Datura stramonium]
MVVRYSLVSPSLSRRSLQEIQRLAAAQPFQEIGDVPQLVQTQPSSELSATRPGNFKGGPDVRFRRPTVSLVTHSKEAGRFYLISQSSAEGADQMRKPTLGERPPRNVVKRESLYVLLPAQCASAIRAFSEATKSPYIVYLLKGGSGGVLNVAFQLQRPLSLGLGRVESFSES